MQKEAKLREFTFPDSGVRVFVPRVSLGAMAMKLQRKHKPPQPPRQLVDYGDGHKVWETNYTHPEYKAAQAEYKLFIDEKATELLLQRVFNFQLTAEHKDMVEAWKLDNEDLWDSLDSDRNLFIEEICITSDADMMALMEFVNSDPSVEAIETAVAGFRSEVPGPGDHDVDDTQKRSDD